ncbi:gp58-like family protein [Lactiplantibacillus plantarum]|uniref:gp58-like family protein n=1 Tax=Lactiplantibacillus plantarum TaxID=1590 RepID=UPI0026554327|nr:gp58-like family protein [Lactiplantibacillus plantarum]MDN7037347.1 hypothetical protein [Lactiplantibacillus plantarum]
MIKQSDLALAAWKATERTLDAVVTINKIDYKTTDIASISYDAGGYTGDTFGIGSNYENSVTIKFSHLIEGLKPGMTVWPKIGIKTSNGYEYSSLGLFIVSDDIQMDRNNDETTIKAYDQMCLLEGTYTSKLTYPAKMTSVIAEIANLAGVLLNTTDISRLPVQVNLPSAITGQTYRNAIGMIAQFYAGFATFDRDGKLTIRTITEPDYTLDPSQYEQGGLTKNEAPYKIGGIQCEVTTTTTDSTGQSTETTNTFQVGAASGSQIKLTNNLMTMDRLASIWQQLQSLTFYPFSLNWFGNPAIEAGDWLTLQDTKGNKFNVPNNGYTMTFDGSLSAVSKADQASTSSSSYAWRGELSQYVADLGGRQGASGNYIYGTDTTEPPYGAKFNDIWYKQNGNKVELWTYERQADGTGKWVLTVSDATGEEVKAKVDQVELEAKASTDAAKAASDKADQLAAKYDDTNALANQALDRAIDAQSDASIAVAQASSAAADSKDAQQIAGAVSQSYKTLTDGSTMTIAELESGLAVKLTKSDLDGYATQTWAQNQINATADGINATLSSVKTTVDDQTTSINDLKADSSSFKAQFTTVNDTIEQHTTDIGTLKASARTLSANFDSLNTDNDTNKHNISQLQLDAKSFSITITTVQKLSTDVSSISQTVDSIKTTVRGKVDNDTYQSNVVRLSNQITSVVGQVNTLGQRNMVANSQFQYDYLDGTSWTGGTTDVWYKTDYTWSWVNGYQGICINQPTNTDSWYNLFSKKIVIGADISTPWSASAYVNIDTVGINTLLSVEFYDTSGVRIGHKESYKDSRGMELIKVENAIPPAGTKTVCLTFSVHGGGHLAMISPMLVNASSVGLYTPDTASWAEFQQTASNINLKVSKDGVINAINVSNEGTSIYGSKLHITAATYIDNAVIKDAMIANLSADKLTAGTINAANINVINLNANNITTGTISGSNLSINLNTGNVQFQAGRIHSADNAIDININDKYISVADNTNRVFISGGEIQMIEPRFLSYQVTPYVRISNEGAGSSIGGATFWARDYFAITNKGNDFNMFSSKMGTESFSGIAGGHSTGGWEVTKVGGADRGVVISGGHQYSNGFISYSPYIRVGDDGKAGAGMGGSNIVMEGDYIYAKSQHTTSRGANAYLAPDGALVPSTSAAKYKTDIVRSFETEMGDKLLEVPVAHWKDKEEVLAKTRDSNAKDPETYFGMIADDLDDAGLNELVEYDDKGVVRSIQYDRVALALIPLIRNYRDRITELEIKVKEMKEV